MPMVVKGNDTEINHGVIIVKYQFNVLNPSKKRSVFVIKLRNSWKSISPFPARSRVHLSEKGGYFDDVVLEQNNCEESKL